MYFDQSQKCPIAEQYYYAPMFYEYCTPEWHDVYSFASSPRSTEHSNHEAYMQHIYGPPSHKPAENFLLQITAKRGCFTIANVGKDMINFSFQQLKASQHVGNIFLKV